MTIHEFNALPAAARKSVRGQSPQPLKPRTMPKASYGRFKNGWESQYAGYLDLRKAAGEVEWWDYEAVRLHLGGGAYFRPDFIVKLYGGKTEYHETKGFMREAARVRIKVAAAKFPYRFVVVKKIDGRWHFEDVKA